MPDQDKPASGAVSSAAEMKGRPHPDDPRKPDSPTDLKPIDWTFTFISTAREFGEDGLTDLAAALTYYAVLSLFPALIALVSILSIVGQGGSAITDLIATMSTMGVLPASAVDSLQPVIAAISSAPAPGLGLLIGLLGAVWSASNYVKAFGRAMNTIYEVQEGRPGIKLNLQMYALTAVLLALIALVIVGIGISGPVTAAIADTLRLPAWFKSGFDYLKLPVLAAAIVLGLALLYHCTPNVRQPKLRWISVGAVVAIVIAGLASAGFAFYIGRFGAASYDRTYGALAGVIIFLFWLWIMNVALLFGGELDAELERARQLRAGMKAEEQIQLPPRDTKQAEKAEAAARKQIEQARLIRLSSGKSDDADADGEGAEGGKERDRRERKRTAAEEEAVLAKWVGRAASDARRARTPALSGRRPAPRTGVSGWLDGLVRRRKADRA